jgi:hypothetical protein
VSTPKVGVWRAVGRLGSYTVREFLWPEGVLGVVIGVGGALLVVKGTSAANRVDAMGEALALAGALLAVVFTGLALVVSIPSVDYIRKMAETPGGGMIRFLDPFLVAVGTQGSILLGGFAYTLGAQHVPRQLEHAGFYMLSFLVVFGLLDVVALARSLVRHGVNRGIEAVRDGQGDSGGEVSRLDERRGGPS